MSLIRTRVFPALARSARAASTTAQPSPAAAQAPSPPFDSPAPSSSIQSTAPPAPTPASSPVPSSSSSTPLSPSPSDPSAPSPVLGRHVPLPQTHGVHVATLHLRSHTDSVPDLQFFTSFALRAARALGLPTSGAAALPTKTSLFTVPRSPFAHKKSQQNFWRKEHKRAIKVFDGNAEVVEAWLAYLRQEALPGVGMKAQVFTYRGVGWGKDLVGQQEADEHLEALQARGGGAGVESDEVERLAKELEEELKAGIEEAEEMAQQGEGEPVVEAAKELKETGEESKEVPVKGEA
ncbi:hypothetical protein JCM10207_006865 [Rhodosporidiobolus poonsookiae]